MAYQHVATTAHYYSRDGKPCYEVETAKGTMRSPDIRDARKNGWIPSVSEYLKIIAKGSGLDNWRIDIFLKAAFANPPAAGEPVDGWLDRVSPIAQAECDKAAQKGTAGHKAIELFLSEKVIPEEAVWIRACDQILAWVQNSGISGIECEKIVVNSEEGIAGRIDLLIHKDEIWDVKTSKAIPRSPWDNWVQQVAGYYLASNLPPKDSGILAIDYNTGEMKPLPISKAEIEEAQVLFRSIMQTWRLLKNYDPRSGVGKEGGK